MNPQPSNTTVRIGISTKLLALFGAVCVLFLILIGYAVYHLHRVGGELSKLSDNQIPALQASSLVKERLFHQQQLLDDFLLSENANGASALAAFRETGAPARELLGDSEKARVFLAALQFMRDAEARHGHLDDREREALDISDLSSAFQNFEKNAARIFEGGARSMEPREVIKLSDSIVEGLEELDKVILAFVEEDARMLNEEQARLTLTVLIAGIVVTVVCAWLVLGLVGKITRPLADLTSTAGRIAGGELGGAIAPIQTGDELEVLGEAFSSMRENLRTQIDGIRSGVETLSAAINEIGASIQEQAASAKEEAATIQEITTTMQEIQQSGSEISTRAREVSKDSENTIETGDHGIDAVQKTSESMERIREQVEEVAEKIVSLSEKTQAIGEIITTVNEISEQSNILAINAGIEAASAGESGARFAVVAQEMKHLADQAKNSTRMVRGILEEIQKGINTSVMLTEEAVKRTESGRAQAAVAQGTIHKLAESVQGNVQTFAQIIAGTGQQQIGINQVVQGMQDIKQAVQQTVSGIGQLEQATRSLNEMSGSLRAVVARYKL